VKIVVNGEPRETTCATHIGELVEELGLPAPAVLVEHNGLALRRDEWPQRPLADSDRVEIIRIVAGG
jgi:thiamine biosynthesis protein ThiS